MEFLIGIEILNTRLIGFKEESFNTADGSTFCDFNVLFTLSGNPLIFGLSKGRYFTASYENVTVFSSSVEGAILGVHASIEVTCLTPTRYGLHPTMAKCNLVG